LEKLSNDLLLKFGSCRSVKQQLPANGPALAQWERGFIRLLDLRMLLEFENLNLPEFVQGPGQPLTAAWLCFTLKYGCQAPIAANARVSCSANLDMT